MSNQSAPRPPSIEQPWLEGDEEERWTEVHRCFVRDRRSYNIHELVLEHVATKACFRVEYSTHEDEGCEWQPGCGLDPEYAEWTRVYPHEVTTIVYRTAPPKQGGAA